jgi:hypothetical protein
LLQYIKLFPDAQGNVRLYCNYDKCRHKALGAVEDVSDLMDKVSEHSEKVHGDRYPFD